MAQIRLVVCEQSCSVSRHVSSRDSLATLFFKISVSYQHLEVSENGHVSAVSFISPMELFQHTNMPKEFYFKAAL